MIALVTMVALISSYLLANVMTRTSTEVRLDNDQRTQQALRDAKAALIAYAASQAWATGTTDQPGALPCPADQATDNYGNAGTSCGAAASGRIGRLPWKKIGASELRDGSSNLLWYSLSASFRNAPNSTVINSISGMTNTIPQETAASRATNFLSPTWHLQQIGAELLEVAPGSALLDGTTLLGDSTGALLILLIPCVIAGAMSYILFLRDETLVLE